MMFNSQKNHALKKNESLIENIDRLHTTPMGVDRIITAHSIQAYP